MSVIDMWQKSEYRPHDIIEPDNMIVAILQDIDTGAIMEKAMPLNYVGRLLASITKTKKSTGNYRVLAIHSYKDGEKQNGIKNDQS